MLLLQELVWQLKQRGQRASGEGGRCLAWMAALIRPWETQTQKTMAVAGWSQAKIFKA